ncbi:MAG: DUF2974 domain-containing protein [Arcobacteraceae bacterium]|jgi:pimeloyl-ACP methyl ester carboxylesterase|nr:DUF2974 domain-containing protein [Arcobacteraceae bacterium]
MASLSDSVLISDYVYHTDGVLPDNYLALEIPFNFKDGFFAEAYRNTQTGEIVIANRGTEITDLGDLKADIQLALFKTTQQEEYAKQFVDAVAQYASNPKNGITFNNVHIVGHSLGGYLTQKVLVYIKEQQSSPENNNYQLYQNTKTSGMILNSPGALTVTVKHHHKNGELFFNQVTISPIFDQVTKKIKHFLWVHQIVTH